MNAAEGAGSSIGVPPPGPKVRTVVWRKSPRPASTNWRPSASSSMWATGTRPLAMASSTMAVRIGGRDLQARLRHLVDPHLDEVDFLASQRADHLARLVRRGGLPGAGVEAARVREAAAGGEHARRVGAAGVGLEHQRRLLGVVGADAARGGDAEVELRPQHLQGRVHVAPVVVVHVHQPGDDGLAGGVDDLRARRDPGGGARPGVDDAVVADDDHRIRDRIAARAVDELGADDGQAARLGGRRRALGAGGQGGDGDQNSEDLQESGHAAGAS